MSFSSSVLLRRDDEDRASPQSSPFRLQGVSPIQSKYRDSDGNDIPIYRTSCPDCHNHVKEMIRIHELWQITKKDLRESRRAHENLLKEYKEEVDKTARQHQRIVDGFHDEIESLRADLKIKAEQVTNLRAESTALQHTTNDVNVQLSLTHERYAEQVSANSVMAIRVRELEQALTHFRLEREAAADATMQSLRDDIRSQTHDIERQKLDLQVKEREIHKLQEIIENQNSDILRHKNAERKQNELFELGSDERTKLSATVRTQNNQLDEAAEEVRQLKIRYSELKNNAELLEDENRTLRSQVSELKNLEEQMETNALNEFRKSRRHIEQRLEKLQSECAQVATMMSPQKGGISGIGSMDRLPDWLPPAVATLVQSFRASLIEGGRNIGEEMSSFLIALNRIWRERLEEKLRQVRLHHAADIRELKRRLAQRIPYEQVVQKARILRLQKDLDSTRAVHLRTKGDQSKGLLDLSLGTVENLSRQILEYERENSLLKNQISLLLNDKNSHGLVNNQVIQSIATQTISAINSLGDKLWGSANTYMDKTLRMAAGTDLSPKLSQECTFFLDALEVDIRSAKASIKKALAEADIDELGGSRSALHAAAEL